MGCGGQGAQNYSGYLRNVATSLVV